MGDLYGGGSSKGGGSSTKSSGDSLYGGSSSGGGGGSSKPKAPKPTPPGPQLLRLAARLNQTRYDKPSVANVVRGKIIESLRGASEKEIRQYGAKAHLNPDDINVIVQRVSPQSVGASPIASFLDIAGRPQQATLGAITTGLAEGDPLKGAEQGLTQEKTFTPVESYFRIAEGQNEKQAAKSAAGVNPALRFAANLGGSVATDPTVLATFGTTAAARAALRSAAVTVAERTGLITAEEAANIAKTGVISGTGAESTATRFAKEGLSAADKQIIKDSGVGGKTLILRRNKLIKDATGPGSGGVRVAGVPVIPKSLISKVGTPIRESIGKTILEGEGPIAKTIRSVEQVTRTNAGARQLERAGLVPPGLTRDYMNLVSNVEGAGARGAQLQQEAISATKDLPEDSLNAVRRALEDPGMRAFLKPEEVDAFDRLSQIRQEFTDAQVKAGLLQPDSALPDTAIHTDQYFPRFRTGETEKLQAQGSPLSASRSPNLRPRNPETRFTPTEDIANEVGNPYNILHPGAAIGTRARLAERDVAKQDFVSSLENIKVGDTPLLQRGGHSVPVSDAEGRTIRPISGDSAYANIPEGHLRLFRGEVPGAGRRATSSGAPTKEGFWTSSYFSAHGYSHGSGQVYAVDVPIAEAERAWGINPDNARAMAARQAEQAAGARDIGQGINAIPRAPVIRANANADWKVGDVENGYVVKELPTTRTAEDGSIIRGTELVKVRKEIAQDFDNVTRLLRQPDEAAAHLREVYDKYFLGLWKGYATTFGPFSGGFAARNFLGNYINGFWLTGANPAEMLTAGRYQQLMHKGFKEGDVFKYLNPEQTRNAKLAIDGGVLDEGFYKSDLGAAVEAGKKPGKLQAVNPLNPNNALLKSGRAFNTAIERNARLGLFLDRLKRGYSAHEATRVVQKYLFDYGDLSKADRAIKEVVPFFTWTRKNVPLQLETLLKQPFKISAQADLLKALRTIDPQNDQLKIPDWARESDVIPFGGKGYIPDLPSTSVNDQIAPVIEALRQTKNLVTGEPTDFGEVARKALLGVQPGGAAGIPQALLQVAFGKQLYSGKQFRPGETQYGIPSDLAFLLENVTPLGPAVTKIRGVADEKTRARRLISAATGISLYDLNKVTKKSELYRRLGVLQALQEWLKNSQGVTVPPYSGGTK